MSHKQRKSLAQTVIDTLKSKERFGHSKHIDKVFGMTDRFIYSFSSMKTYIKHCLYFTDWVRANDEITKALGHKARTLEECKPYIEQFIRQQEQRGLSAYTVKMELSAIEKLYGEKFDIQTIGTKRANIKRSRGAAVRDKHFSEERNSGFVAFCRCVGCRRAEYEKIKPDDLSNGFITITGKGGKTRQAPISGTADEIAQAMEHLKTLTGHNTSPSNADIHSYRADYATKIYKDNCPADLSQFKGLKINYTALTGKYGKDGKPIYKSALYVCRGDRKGEVLYRPAMIKASQALGHNRESVVGEHYIRI